LLRGLFLIYPRFIPKIAHHLSLKPAEFFEAMLMQQRLFKMPSLNLSWPPQS
jgi:hypothetical protein